MLPELSFAFALLGACVAIHAVGITWIARKITLHLENKSQKPRAGAWLLILTAWGLAVLHIFEIILWGAFYSWQNCLPDFGTSIYYSGVTYTTIGYGDIVLPRNWWLLGPMEGLTGILMCGVSTGFFFVVVSKLFTVQLPASPERRSSEP